jgi:hypothetical protein
MELPNINYIKSQLVKIEQTITILSSMDKKDRRKKKLQKIAIRLLIDGE